MYIVINLITIVVALVLIVTSKNRRSLHGAIRTFLLSALAISIGVMGIMGFIGHTYKAAEVAQQIGWPAGNPFQFEIAIASLGMGVLGILCIWIRGNFWLATIIFSTIFGWGAAFGHIYQYVKFNNAHPGNTGAVLYNDILLPIVLIALYAIMKTTSREKLDTKRSTYRLGGF